MKEIPLYIQIAEDIKSDIKIFKYRTGDKLPSQHELMEKYSASRVTVIGALTKLKNEGYITIIKGSGSFVADTDESTPVFCLERGTVGVVIPFLRTNNTESDHMEYLRGINKYLDSADYRIAMYGNSGESEETRVLQRAVNDGCNGIIYYFGESDTYPLVTKLAANRYPIVIIDKTLPELEIASVATDNFKATYDTAAYLLKKGYKSIGFITNTALYDTETVKQRYKGYCSALADAGIEQDFRLTKIAYETSSATNKRPSDTDKRHGQIREAVKEMVQCGCDAVITHSDHFAREIISVCSELNIAIPSQLAVTGFDDLSFCSYTTPTLTSVKQDFFQIGYLAAQSVVRLINDKSAPREKLLVDGKLIERRSS